MAIAGFIIASFFKALDFMGYGIQAVSYILSNEIWFVIEMCLSVWNIRSLFVKGKYIAIPMGLSFVALSVLFFELNLQSKWIGFAMGVLACFLVIVLVMSAFSLGRQSVIFGFLAKYTMPVFLMHTLFTAPLRVVLLRLGVHNAIMHVTLGIVISLVGPIIAAEVMKKCKSLEFFHYPGKFIKCNK